MIRFLVLYKQPNSVEEFERHYREVHIPLAMKIPGLQRYSVSRNIRTVRGDETYYLIAELEWDDRGALERGFQSPEGRATAADVNDHLSRLSPGIQSMLYELEDAQA